jgi:RHS repeat-associated protein
VANRRARSRAILFGVSALLTFQVAYAPPEAIAADPSLPPSAPTPSGSPSPKPSPAPSAQVVAASPAPPPDGAAAVDAKPNEIVDRRTATSDVVDNGDGTQTTSLYSDQVYYKPRGAKAYQPIHVGFAPGVAGDKSRISKDAPVSVQVAPGSDGRGFLTVDIDGHTIRYKPVAAAALSPVADAAPSTKGALSDAAEVVPGVGARILARANGAHVFFVLKSAADAAKLTFHLETSDLTIASDKNGGFEFRDAEGTLVARMPNPYAVDSTPDSTGLGSGHSTNKVAYDLAGTGSPWTLTVTVDPTWLKGATYPVYVDPTIVNGGGTTYGDTFTNPGNAGFNYGNYCRPDTPYYCELWLGQSPSPTSDVGSDLIRFDITPVLNTTIDTASLQIFPYHQYQHATPVNTWVRQVSSNWSESTTYNTRPSVLTSPVVTGTTAEDTWSNFNVLTIVRNWVHSGQANYGFRIDENGNNYLYWKRVVSAEETGYAHAEKLVITNHLPVATAVEPTGWTADKTVSWSYSDSMGAAQSHYHVDVASDAGFASIIGTSGDLAGSVTSYTFSAALTAGATYYWRVKVKNGTSWSTFASHSFSWDPSSPNIQAFSQPATNPTFVGSPNSWAVAWPQVTSSSGISLLNVHQDSGPVITPGTCDDATVSGSTQWAVGPTTTSYQVSGGLSGYCYWYYLDATNGVGTNAVGPTSNPVLVDTTTPTTAFTWPTAGTTTTAINPTVEWTEGDTGSGVATRTLQRQVTTVTGPGVCGGSWANDGSPSAAPSPAAQITSVGSCYQWVLTLTDQSGNQTTVTSGKVIRDATAGLGQLAFQRYETWPLGGGDQVAVNVGSGNAVISHPIVTLPIRGSSTAIGLTYNSQDAADIGVGPGWRLNVQRRLTLNADGTVTFIDASGARHWFSAPSTVGSITTYTRPATLYATLIKDTTQSHVFTLTYRDQSRDRFDILGSEAILARSEDRFGNGVDLAYTAGTTRISTITDSASRVITFTWNGASHLASIADWAYIDASGVVQTGATGSHRTHRFFYDGANLLLGWSDPLNTAGACPTNASHLACLTYTAGLVTGIAKWQTVEAMGATAMATTTQIATTAIAYAGSDVTTVTDAEQNAQGSPARTTFTRLDSTSTVAARPATSLRYRLLSASDPLVRVESVYRNDLEDGVEIEQRTTFDAAFPTEPATVTDNFGALLQTPSRSASYTYVAGSLGMLLRMVEPLTASPATNRRTDYTYSVNNDALTKTVSQDGASPIVTKSCFSADCTTNTGLTLLAQIDNYVSGGPQNADTNVTTDYTYDAYGQRTRETRHNRDAAGGVRDDRVTGFTYDSIGNQTGTIVNYVDGLVTNGGQDVSPDANGVRTDLVTTTTFDTAGNAVSSADPRRAIEVATAGTTYAADTYTRTVTDAWGSANTGGTWSGTNADFDVANNEGTINLPAIANRSAFLTSVIAGDQELLVRVRDNQLTVGADTFIFFHLRRQDVSNFYEARVIFNASQQIRLQFRKTVAGAAGAIGLASTTAEVHTTGAYYWLRARLTGTTAVNLKMRLWRDGTTEPAAWALDITDAAPPAVLQGSGHVGVRFQALGTGTYPVVASIDDLALTTISGSSLVGADDYISRHTFDALNEQLTETTPTRPGVTIAQKTSSSTYDEFGGVREATDFGGVVTGTAYDRAARATTTFEDTGGPGAIAPVTTAAMTIDADGRVVSAKDRAQVADASLGRTETHYDSQGRTITVTEAAAAADTALASDTTTTYDALDRSITQTVGGQDTTSTYDLGGRVTSTDDGFACTVRTFDYRDLLLTVTSGLTGGTCASNAGARTVTASFDGLGREYRDEVTVGPGTGDRTQDDSFDSASNRLTTAVRTGGTTRTTAFTVNVLDLTVAEMRTDGSTAKSTYDPSGNPTDHCYWKPAITVGSCLPVGTAGWTNPPTQSTSTTFDARNKRIGLTDSATNATTTYDPNHLYKVAAIYQPTVAATGREHQTVYGYDTRHRLVSILEQNCVISSLHACSSTAATASDSYAYDNNDNRIQVIESSTGAAGLALNYCYDGLDRLRGRNTAAACTTISGDETYTYDDAGNRLTAPGNAFTNNADGQLTGCTTGCGAVAHDSTGRMSSLNGWTFGYDSEGRLTSASAAAGSIVYAYDGEGHRTSMAVTPTGFATTTTSFRYQGDAIVEESVGSTVTRSYTVDDAGTIRKMTIPVGQTGTGTYLVTWNGHGDALGLWLQNADGSLALVNSYTYSSWGTPATSVASGTDLGFRFLYVGASDVQWDNQLGLGLLYMHARHYSPTVGRFLQPDPSRAESNLYAYTTNNPVTKQDACGTMGFANPPPGSQGWCMNKYNIVVQRVKLLIQRFREQLRGDPRKSTGHLKAYRNAQVGLRNMIDQYEDQGCPGKYKPLPKSAYDMAKKPFPSTWSERSNNYVPLVGAAGLGAFGLGWWLGKLLSPLCGPAFFACAWAF